MAALEALAGLGVGGEDPATGAWLAELKVDRGQVGRDALTAELGKLARGRNLGLPSGLFDSWSDSLARRLAGQAPPAAVGHAGPYGGSQRSTPS